MSKLKEDFAKSDLEKDKLIMDLSVKFERAKTERSQFELELTKTKEALIRSDNFYQGRISTLEDQLGKSQAMYVELDDSTKKQLEKHQSQGTSDSSELYKKFDLSLKRKDENLRQL